MAGSIIPSQAPCKPKPADETAPVKADKPTTHQPATRPSSATTTIRQSVATTQAKTAPKAPTRFFKEDFIAIFRRVLTHIDNAAHSQFLLNRTVTSPSDFNPVKEYINEVKNYIKVPYSLLRRINDVCDEIDKKKQTSFKRGLDDLELERTRLLEIRHIALEYSAPKPEINRFVAALDFIYEAVEAQATNACDKNIALNQAKTVAKAFLNPEQIAAETRTKRLESIRLSLSNKKHDRKQANEIQKCCEFTNKILRGLNK